MGCGFATFSNVIGLRPDGVITSCQLWTGSICMTGNTTIVCRDKRRGLRCDGDDTYEHKTVCQKGALWSFLLTMWQGLLRSFCFNKSKTNPSLFATIITGPKRNTVALTFTSFPVPSVCDLVNICSHNQTEYERIARSAGRKDIARCEPVSRKGPSQASLSN